MNLGRLAGPMGTCFLECMRALSHGFDPVGFIWPNWLVFNGLRWKKHGYRAALSPERTFRSGTSLGLSEGETGASVATFMLRASDLTACVASPPA
jgi:hypothetical protein